MKKIKVRDASTNIIQNYDETFGESLYFDLEDAKIEYTSKEFFIEDSLFFDLVFTNGQVHLYVLRSKIRQYSIIKNYMKYIHIIKNYKINLKYKNDIFFSI